MRILAAILLLASATVSAQTNSAPMVALLDIEVKCLLGGAQNKRWIAPEIVAPQKDGQEKYDLLNIKNESVPFALTGKIRKADEPPCPDTFVFEADDKPEFKNSLAIEQNHKWNVQPRFAFPIDAKNQTYTNIVAEVLRGKGIAKSAVKIEQAVRVDLEGDGADEVVIVATNYKNGLAPSAAAGDYSFVLLRKIVNGAPQNIVVNGDFITKPVKFGAPGRYYLTAIGDLNGDGVMEIVTRGEYYEGAWSEIYEVKSNRATKVLSCACGA